MAKQQLVLVLGMGRSGSSALTRVLSLCGATLPEPLLGATPSNLKGHWEPRDALNLNEDFLARHGANWFDPTFRLQEECGIAPVEQRSFVDQIQLFLEDCPKTSPLLIKEPRITGLSRFWLEAAHRAGYAIKVVLPVRHPDECAASLRARDAMSLELASILWLKYSLIAERESRGFPRVFVEYWNLLGDWRQEVERVMSGLGIDLSVDNGTAVEEFLTPELHHQRHTGAPQELLGSGAWTSRVYAALSAAARDMPVDFQMLDDICSDFRACERALRVSLDEFRVRFAPERSPSSQP